MKNGAGNLGSTDLEVLQEHFAASAGMHIPARTMTRAKTDEINFMVDSSRYTLSAFDKLKDILMRYLQWIYAEHIESY